MISKPFITKLKKDIEATDAGRGKVIRATHELVQDAKNAIFKIHRGEMTEARTLIHSIEKRLTKEVKDADKKKLRDQGSLKAAIEEFLEAYYLLLVIEGKLLPPKLSFAPEADEQLAALSDLTGELVRAATLEVTKKRYDTVRQYRDATEELFGVLLSMNLRGNLRQKRDDARRNLRRLEEILYDVSLVS